LGGDLPILTTDLASRASVWLSASVGFRRFLARMSDQSFLLSGKKF
jgi:hypothetical protein